MTVTTPIRIITGDDISGPSDPVRIANWTDLVSAIVSAIGNGDTDFDYIQFNVNPTTPTFSEGLVYWDADVHTLNFMTHVDGVINQVGQELYLYARNNTGAQIDNGEICYISGALGNRPTVALARADAPATACTCAIATHDVPPNTDGYFTTFGVVRDVNTAGMVAGQALYLSAATAGAFTNTAPLAPNFIAPIGRVLRVNPTQGMILFYPRGVAAFGDLDGGNYTRFESDGTFVCIGNATCYLDLLQSVTGAQITSPAGDFQQNIAEASVTAKTSARYPTDYITTNWQLNHDMLPGTQIFPHIHWWQTTTNTPHWVIAYRWQAQGQAKVTAWTPIAWVSNAFIWTAGTLNQITGFGPITPPVNYGQVSDIVQIRLYRDYTNVSTLFAGGDPVAANQDIVNLDTHYQVNMLGSHQEYIK